MISETKIQELIKEYSEEIEYLHVLEKKCGNDTIKFLIEAEKQNTLFRVVKDLEELLK